MTETEREAGEREEAERDEPVDHGELEEPEREEAGVAVSIAGENGP